MGNKPKILFEGHVFWRQPKKHGLDPNNNKAGNENILYSSWTRKHYFGGAREHERLNDAKKIHEDAALQYVSW